MSDYDFQCLLCGSQFDGILRVTPERCPACGGPESDIVDADAVEEMIMRNKAINKHDEDLEERI